MVQIVNKDKEWKRNYKNGVVTKILCLRKLHEVPDPSRISRKRALLRKEKEKNRRPVPPQDQRNPGEEKKQKVG